MTTTTSFDSSKFADEFGDLIADFEADPDFDMWDLTQLHPQSSQTTGGEKSKATAKRPETSQEAASSATSGEKAKDKAKQKKRQRDEGEHDAPDKEGDSSTQKGSQSKKGRSAKQTPASATQPQPAATTSQSQGSAAAVSRGPASQHAASGAPDYNSMKPEELKALAARYGMRPAAKYVLVAKLTQIWDALHPQPTAPPTAASAAGSSQAPPPPTDPMLEKMRQEEEKKRKKKADNIAEHEGEVVEGIKKDRELWEKILSFRSVKMAEVMDSLRANGVTRPTLETVRSILDKNGVTFV